MPEFGFIGASYIAASPTQSDDELYNWYPEVSQAKQQGERGVIALYPTPGLTLRLQSATIGEVRDFHVIPGGSILLAVIGNTLYSITTGYVATAVGVLTTTNGACSITDNGTSAYIVDGQNRYTYVWSTGVFAQIAIGDGPFVGGGQCDEVDNFIIYSNPGTNQWGCTNVGSTISGALNLGIKLGSSDNLVGIIADHRDVLLIGETTTEDWVNVGTFPFPTPTSGESPKVNLLGYAYGVAANADAAKEAAAAALVKCRASEENQIDTAVQGGYIPALTSAQDAFVEQVPAAAPFVDAVDGAYNSAQLGTEWNTLQQQYVDAIQSATVGGQTAQAALEQASGQ